MTEMVSMQGRITVNNAGEMRRTLADALRSRAAKVTVDLSGVPYMDTSGLATLMEAMQIARHQGTRLILRGIQEQPRSLLEVTELDQVFEMEEGAST
jgi:anti-sigma B factor antagonist